MKKILLMLTVILIAGTYVAKAQIQRGNVLVGTDISNFTLESKKFTMAINPKAAWFIRDNTALGAYFNFELTTIKGEGTQVTYGVGALARQYLTGNALNALRHTRFFLEGTVGIEGKNASASSTGESTNGLGLGIGPGMAYFITPNIGLEGLLKYNGIVGFGNTTATSTLSLNVGFQVYLPGRTIQNAVRNTQ